MRWRGWSPEEVEKEVVGRRSGGDGWEWEVGERVGAILV